MSNEDAWYVVPGPENDVIISTRVRLARNLADFPFINKMSADDKQRVSSLVYDAMSADEKYTFIDFSQVAEPGRELLKDKCIIENSECTSILMNSNESVSVVVNDVDHVRISNFAAGLNCESTMAKVYKVDEYLQQKLQFAASYQFGYLTAKIKDCGTGMKMSLFCFIPGIILGNKLEEVASYLREHNFSISSVYQTSDYNGDFGNCIFEICTNCSAREAEFDQLATTQAAGLYISKMERKIRKEFADNNPTIVTNYLSQAVAKYRFSYLLSFEEGVDILSGVKWGIALGHLTGIEQHEIDALYYRTKSGHLGYLCDNYSFDFEDDIKTDHNLQIQRLRAIVIQQAFENVKFKV